MDADDLTSLFNQYKERAHNQLKDGIRAAYELIPADLRTTEATMTTYSIINGMSAFDPLDDMYKHYIALLASSLHLKRACNVHISFVKILQSIDDDELIMIKNIGSNDYRSLETYDFVDNRFVNYKEKRMDFPKQLLKHPNQFSYYYFHLQDTLKLIRWPVEQEAIIEKGKQVGLAKTGRFILTILGKQFYESIFFL